MSLRAKSYISTDTDSTKVAAAAAGVLNEAFASDPLKAVLVYASVNHDQRALLRTLRAKLGPDVLLVGCSVQGLAGPGFVREGLVMGVLGLGGQSLRVEAAIERAIETDTRAKGRRLAAHVASRLGEAPKVGVVLYDPLCNADVDQMLSGITEEMACPLVGGGAGQPFGPVVKTFQYWQDEVVEHAAIAIGLAGPFSAELGVCHGTSPTGLQMTVTRTEGNAVLEIDGRRAVDVWREVIGCTEEDVNNQDYIANWAIGIERTMAAPNGEHQSMYFVRASFGFDLQKGALFVQAAIPEGTRIMMHHRTVAAVTEGTAAMGRELVARLKGRRPWAVLGFECGARTSPFLGEEVTLKENLALQAAVAPDAPWLGMMAWGEIAPAAGRPAFHNYTYPLLVLAT
jgi:hypothetical protein